MKGQKPTPKCSPEERNSRNTQCLKWLSEGKTPGWIVREGSKLWGVSDRQVHDYYSSALEIVSARYKRIGAKIVDELHQRLETIVDRSLDEGELDVARKALMDIGKITGAVRDQIDVNDVKAPDLSQIPREKLIGKLRRE